MVSVGGNLRHAGTRFGAPGGFTPIVDVPICLFRVSDGKGMYTRTGSNGEYSFINVDVGDYKIIECGKSVAVAGSVADFSNATVMTEPVPADPEYSKITTPIANTNVVDSLSPNTLLVSIANANLTGKDFLDSTIKNTPLSIPSGVIIDKNILKKAGNGIFGTLPNGTPANTVPPSYPYQDSMTSGFTYLPGGISQGVDDFFMKNIQTRQWFSLSNHTTFDETSSYISINGGNPNIIIFFEEVDVLKNRYYLASAWLCMNTDIPNTCKIGFRALAEDF
ncbi:MAG: carboxypeptidase-like regulatory domain-containing protein, partial [Clostridium sp.]|uniref:carboxypeptidase-like regulatory domain-containing protein n=1 Tax=Clostridium sp. TaxID=1506 RepID=UPI003F3C07BA